MFRYGLFRLAQIWTITDESCARLGYLRRELALAALSTMLAVHRAAHQDVMVTVQGDDGELRTMLNPLDVDALDGPANDDNWDVVHRSPNIIRMGFNIADNDEVGG